MPTDQLPNNESLVIPDKKVYSGTQLFLNRLARVPRWLSRGSNFAYDTTLESNWRDAVAQAEKDQKPLFLDIRGMFSNSRTRGETTGGHYTIPRQFGASLILASMNLHQLFQEGSRDGNIHTREGVPEFSPEFSSSSGTPKGITNEWIRWAQKKDKRQQERKFTVEVEGDWKDDVRTLIITNNELGIRVEITLDNSLENPNYRNVRGYAPVLGGNIRFAPGVKVTPEMVRNAFTAPRDESKAEQDKREQQHEYSQQQRKSGSESKSEAKSGQKTDEHVSFVGMPPEDVKTRILEGFTKLESTIAQDFRGDDTLLDLQIFGATTISQHNAKSLRIAYRALVTKYHPDLHPEKPLVLIQRITQAYNNLAELV